MSQGSQSKQRSGVKSNYRFSLFKEENELKQLVDRVAKQKPDKLNDKVCVVSVIGKSELGANSCKAELIDEALGKNVFKGLFHEEKLVDEEILNEIEGYYDAKNNIVFLHLISPFDTDQMTKVLKKLNRKLKERGFLDIWSDLNLNTTKCILLMFLVSHIVVLVTPSIQVDIHFLSFFRLIDQLRGRTQSSVSDLLKEIPDLSKNWTHLGRPCSPRVVFVFEAYDVNDHLVKNKRKYELYLEDQMYRFLRKSRVITNICSNALFAICNQANFVYISTSQSSIRDPDEFFNELLTFYCGQSDVKPITLSANVCSELLSLDEVESEERTFFNFLWTHINTALTKGFDDNVGRHNVTPIFELPKLATFARVFGTLKDFLFKQLTNESSNTGLKSIANKLSLSLDADTMFSESRCNKILPVAFSFYREKLPANYTQEIHEQKLNQTLQFFSSQVRGLCARKYMKVLEQDCQQYWKNGHQVCGVPSLFGNHCMNPIHRPISTGEAEANQTDGAADSQLKMMDHCSNIKYISACNCGHRQGNRDDPFSIKQANFDFFQLLSAKCSCNELAGFEFPVFEGAMASARPALFNEFLNLDLEDEFYSSEESSNYEDETDNEEATKENQLAVPENDDLVAKLQTQLESQPDRSQSNDPSDDFVGKKLEPKKGKVDKRISSNESGNSSTTSSSSTSDDDLQQRIMNSRKRSSRRENAERKSGYSKTEYLIGMLNSKSPKNLLPVFNSWSLLCLGPSSIYSHNLGVQNQPGFIQDCNYLLPYDVTVKIEHSGDLPKAWSSKKLPGIKNKKVLQDGTQFTVKIFIGMEYECLKGHRFFCSKPNTVLKSPNGQIKETASQVVSSDMPLFMPCACSGLVREDEKLAQLMRIHVVTPKAPVFVTLNPRVQMSTQPCPIFYPMSINENKPDEMIKLTQSAYWILRLPFVYQQMINSPITKIYAPSPKAGYFLKDAFGICKFITSDSLSGGDDKADPLGYSATNARWV